MELYNILQEPLRVIYPKKDKAKALEKEEEKQEDFSASTTEANSKLPLDTNVNPKIDLSQKQSYDGLESDFFDSFKIKNINTDNQGRIKDFTKEKELEKKLEKLNYPKTKPYPVDIEIIDGEQEIFFNIEKWINYKKPKPSAILLSLLPLPFLDQLTYNRDILDNYATKLFKKNLKYNEANAKTQYKMDKVDRNKNILKYLLSFILILLFILFIFLPKRHKQTAVNSLRNGDYQVAFEEFNDLKANKENVFYRDYSKALSLSNQKKFSEAKDIMSKLQGYNSKYTDTNNALKEIYYQEGLYALKQKNYAKAKDNFSKVYKYKDSKDKFFEASLYSLDQLMDAKRYKEVLETGKLIKGYKDADARLDEYKEQIYQEAKAYYKDENFSKAEELFLILAEINYKDSKTMIYQSQYNLALEYLDKDDTKNATKVLQKIQWFKDSKALLNRLYYQEGKKYLNKDNFEAFYNFTKSISYKDSKDYLKSNDLALYGEFRIENLNGSFINNTYLTFDNNNHFRTNKENSIALEDLYFNVKYDYTNGIAKYKDNTIEVRAIDLNNINIIVNKDKNLLLRRIQPLDSLSNIKSQDLEKDIRDYVEKKIDKAIESKDGSTDAPTEATANN